MKIGIISDTHDHVEHIKQAAAYFKGENVSLVIHAGDYCSPFAVLPFEGLKMIGVFGNNDGDHFRIISAFNKIGAEMEAEFCEFEEDGISIAVYHGTHPAITDALVRSGNYDLVVSGHTHDKVIKQVNGTLSVNPGSANGFDGEATVAVYDTSTKTAEFHTL